MNVILKFLRQRKIFSQKRGVFVEIKEQLKLLENLIDSCQNLPKNDALALEKDTHILAAALVSDRLLITTDKALKTLTDKWLHLSIEWLLQAQENHEKWIARVQDLSRKNPYPKLPA